MKCLLTELENENWLHDLGLTVLITEHLNDLNVQLQGPSHQRGGFGKIS